MKAAWLVLVLWVAVTAANAAEPDRLHQQYDEGLQLYWAGKLNESSLKLAEVVDQSPLVGLGIRAAYMMGILQEKMSSNELAVLNQEIATRYPILAAYQKAQVQLTNLPPNEAFAQLVDFTVMAPTPAWRNAGVEMIFGRDWPDDVVPRQLEAANVLADILAEQSLAVASPRQMRFLEQLIRHSLLRGEYTRQLQLQERLLAVDMTPGSVISLVKMYQAAGRKAEAWTCYTSMLDRVKDPGLLGAAMMLTMLAGHDIELANDSLTVAQSRAGTNHTELILTEAILREETFDLAGAQRVLASSEDPYVVRAREELQLRLPAHYDLVWNVTVTGALGVVVNSNQQPHVYCRQASAPEQALVQINEQGLVVKTIPLQGPSRFHFTTESESPPPFALHPDGSFLVGSSLYSPRGEFILALPTTPQPPIREEGSADISPTEGIAIITRRGGGLSRYTLDGQPVFRDQDPEATQTALSGVIWIGTNITLIDGQRAIIYNNQGVPLRTLDWVGDEGPRLPKWTHGPKPGGVRTDSAGLIYLASEECRGVRIMDQNFKFISQIPMIRPKGCAVAHDGSVYVVHNSQLARFVPKNGGPRALMKRSPPPP